MTDSEIIHAGGYEIHSWYAGFVCFAVYTQDGKEVYHGCSLGDVVRIVGYNPFH